MPFIGAIANAAKGVVEKKTNRKLIQELEHELSKDLMWDFTYFERLNASIKLKEVELEIAETHNQPRRFISNLEKEIVELMESKLSQQETELKRKPATQLDIAKTVVTFQKSSNQMKDYIVQMEKDLRDVQKTEFREMTLQINDSLTSVLDSTKRQHKEFIGILTKQSEAIDGIILTINDLGKNLDQKDKKIAQLKKRINMTQIIGGVLFSIISIALVILL